jgi:drug/metabolite transporter (DMT)-like permease
MEEYRQPRWATFVLVAGVCATSWAAIFVRLAAEAPALTMAAYRLVIGTAVVASVAAWGLWARRDRLPHLDQLPWLVLSGALLAGHFWSWFASLERTSVGSSVVIVGMQPLLGGALGFIFLGESPRRNEYAGVAVALVGLLVIGWRDFGASPGALGGDLLALLGGFLAACYRTVGRSLRPGMSAAMYSATVYGVAAAVLWLLVLAIRPQAGDFEPKTWTFIVLLGLVPQVIGHTAFNWALAHFRVVTVSLANVGEPVAATLLAIPILGEYPSAALWAGGPLIIAGVVMGLWGSSATRSVVEIQDLEP